MYPKLTDLNRLEKDSIYISIPDANIQKGDNQDKIRAAYSATMYRQYGVSIQPFSSVNLEYNDKPVYFHTSKYIPYFKQHGYKLDVITGTHLIEYLQSVQNNSYVIISLKDEGSQHISKAAEEQLKSFGINLLDRTKLRHSYVWVAQRKDDNTFEILHEACSELELHWSGFLHDINVNVKSGGALSTNLSSIMINEVEHSLNERGLNIVTYSIDGQIEAVTFDTFVTLYMKGSLFLARKTNKKRNVFHTIAHAGGQLEGFNYTNCKEAFELNYQRKGHRVFEADIEITSDNELVLRHDWMPYLYSHLKQQPPEGIAAGHPLSLEHFKSLPILHKYTPWAFTDLMQFLVDHPDAYIITDTKHTNSNMVKLQFSKIVEAAAPFGYYVLLRVIPQLYTEEMYEVIDGIFPFPRYVYTLYQTKATDEEVIAFVKEKGIDIVALSPERFNNDLVQKLNMLDTSVALHTINDIDIINDYIKQGVGGFYTDSLSSYEINEAFISYELERQTYQALIVQYLILHYHITEEQAKQYIKLSSLDELKVLSEQLFKLKTIEEVHDLFNKSSTKR